MLTRLAIVKKMEVPADKAWQAISEISRLDVWFPSIKACRVEGHGVGAHRYMRLEGGGEIVDRILEVDSAAKRLTYQRIRSPFPVTSYRGTVEVFRSFDELAVVVWTIDFESSPENSEPVAGLLQASISAGLDGMEADLQSHG